MRTNIKQIDGTGETDGDVLTIQADGTVAAETPSGGGSGDVVGPASATDNAVARFDGTTGELIQDTDNVVIDDPGTMTMTPDADKEAIRINPPKGGSQTSMILIEDKRVGFNETGMKFVVTTQNGRIQISDFGSTRIDFQAGFKATFVSTPVSFDHTNIGDSPVDILGGLTLRAIATPADPPTDDSAIIYVKAGGGDDGDLMVKINKGGTTKTITLVDWSAA